MSESVPQFGEKAPDASYIARPGVYGLIRDPAGRVAVVCAGEACFLPGGGIVPGETLDQAMDREAREECGRSARILRTIGRADQHCVTRSGRHFTKQCTYVEAEFVVGWENAPTEPDHQLLWLSPGEALKCLALGADRWALQQFLSGATHYPD